MLVPITATAPPDGNEMGVPDTVITAPCARVCPSIMKCEDASAVYDEPSKDSTAGDGVITGELLRDWVLVPTTATAAPDANDIGVPETEIAAPGAKV